MSPAPVPTSVTPTGIALDRLVRGCALAVLTLGLLVLAGWALGIEALKSLLPGLASMKANTALGFVLAGLALGRRQHRGLRLGCAATLCLLGGLSLTQDLTGADFGIDQWLFRDAPGAAQTVHPGRMSAITAINFTLCGVALLLLGSERAASRRTLEALALLAGTAALLALTGYAYGAEALYRLPGFGSIAVHTALAFMLLAIGILGARPDGLAGIFASADLGGQVARRFLPLALLAPLLLGGLAQLGEHAGLLNSTQKTAAYAAAMVLVLAVLTWRNALLLQRSDAERQQAETQLREREALLATLTGRARVGMVMVTTERRYAFANSAYAEVLGLPITDIVGRRVPDVLAPVYESQVRPRLDRAFAGEPVSYDLRLPPLAEGASERHFAITYDPPVETAHGPCVIVLVVDVTERTRAEAELRESENKFSIMFSQAAVPTVLSRPPEHVIVDANDAWLRLFGYDKAEVVGRTSIELGINRHPARRVEVIKAIEQAGAAHNLEQTLFTRSGAQLQLLVNVQLITIGGQVHAVTSMQDITERKQRERNLAFLADLQKLFAPLTSSTEIMHTATEAIARHFDLMHCLLMEIDPAAEHATLLHDHHAANVPGLSGVYRIADFQTDAERHEMEAGRTVVIDDVHLDGRTAERVRQFEAMGIGALVNAPYLAQGRWKFLLSVLRARPHAWSMEDTRLLTELAARLYVRIERARAEEQLRASEERMRLAAAAAQFGMYDRDLRGTEFHASDQLKRMLGYAADEPFDRERAMSHFHPDDRALGVAAFQRACDPAGDGRIAIEQRIVRRDGVVRWIASVGQVLFKDGVPDRSLGFWVDITAAKEAEELRLARDEAQRAAAEMALTSKYKSEFLANMSHELRTPLNSLLILARMLADNKPGNLNARQVEFAETIYQSGQDLLRLINEILDLSRIEAGQMVMRVEPVALAGLAEKIERDFRHVAQSKRLDFSVRLDPQLPALIQSDAARIEQVLKNLLANSFKFTDQGDVRLSIRRATDGWSRPHPSLDRAGSVVAFAVSDSGIGIAPDKQLLIFEAFAQVDGTTSRKYGGTGLGLTISRELASRLGGAITLTSQPGVGSLFTLYLPDSCGDTPAAPASDATPDTRPLEAMPDATADTMPAATPESAPPAPAETAQAPLERPHGSPRTLTGKTVLVVDDDIRNVFALFAILENAGIVVRHAENGQQCLDLLQADADFDVVLMDIMMPGMDGYETMRRLRAQPHLAELPIIALTAKAMKGDREKCLEAGANDYLAKPVNAEQLLALLRQWIEP